jgi:hypothetical protein
MFMVTLTHMFWNNMLWNLKNSFKKLIF